MSKRLLDVIAAAVGLIMLAPLMVVIAIAVRVDSNGPALFRQLRVGRDGRPFEILKFRSMRVPGLRDPARPHITISGDARVTHVGAILRRTKLDELPQLINVLMGDMSLVGPRPEVPRYVSMYPTAVRLEILSVRPGITDEAAIAFRDESEILGRSDDPERTYVEEILPQKIDCYLRYVRTRSFFGDLGILLRTLWRVAVPDPRRRDGAPPRA
jgi:lipopolysaccharide/colanic/teichoic acid biosynthesis glycosyltransferase